MSNSDYTKTAIGQSFCPVAVLASTVTPLATNIPITGLKSVGPGDRYAGMAAMIGNEIVAVTAINEGSVDVKRGCADTVPAEHAASSIIWFFESGIGSDFREYGGTQTLALKVLPKTNSGQVPIESSPPQNITLNNRFIRPYAPGDVRVGGTSVYTADTPRITAAAGMSVTWANRNRVVQLDQLIGHTEATTTPEDGQTTRVRIYSTTGNVLRATKSLTDTSWTYDRATAAVDIPLVSDSGDTQVYALIDSMRDGYSSWQGYRLDFLINTTGLVPSTPRLTEDGTTRITEDGTTRILES